MTSIKIKNQLYTKFLKTRSEYYQNQYKIYRNKLKNLIALSKKKYFETYFQKSANDMKSTWKGIKQIISTKFKDFLTPTKIILEDGETLTDANDIANSFNVFFANVGSKMSSQVPPTATSPLTFLKSSPANSFYLYPCSSNEIEIIINGLSLNKATGPFSIPTGILKVVSGITAKSLETLCNLSFSTGTVPDSLKIAKVIPLFKMVPEPLDLIIDQSHNYPYSIRFLKNLCITDLYII